MLKNSSRIIRLALITLFFVLSNFNAYASDTLQNRWDRLQRFLDAQSQNITYRLEIQQIIEYFDPHNKEARIRNGLYVWDGSRMMFDHTSYFASDLEACMVKKQNMVDAEYGKFVRSNGFLYQQFDPLAGGSVESYPYQGDLYPEEPLHLFKWLSLFHNDSINLIQSKPELANLTSTNVMLEGNIPAQLYRILTMSDSDGDRYSNLYFSAEDDSALPILSRVTLESPVRKTSTIVKSTRIFTNPQSALGFDKYIIETTSIPDEFLEAAKKPGAVNLDEIIRTDSRITVSIEKVIEVNGPVFPEEFQFRIPKGKRMVSYQEENNEFKEVSVVAEEDQIIEP